MLYIIAIVNFESSANFIGFVYITFIWCCHMLYMFNMIYNSFELSLQTYTCQVFAPMMFVPNYTFKVL